MCASFFVYDYLVYFGTILCFLHVYHPNCFPKVGNSTNPLAFTHLLNSIILPMLLDHSLLFPQYSRLLKSANTNYGSVHLLLWINKLSHNSIISSLLLKAYPCEILMWSLRGWILPNKLLIEPSSLWGLQNNNLALMSAIFYNFLFLSK